MYQAEDDETTASREMLMPSVNVERWHSAENAQKRPKRAMMVAAGFITATIFLIVTLGWSRNTTWPLTSTSQKVCGSSRAEALNHGCEFDVMSFSWLPAHCYDKDLTEDFLAAANWTWTTDEIGQEVVPFTEVSLGLHDELFVTWSFHLFHCAYAWRKLHRDLEAGHVDSYLANIEHTHHCSQTLLEAAEYDHQSRNTIIRTKFVEC